MKVDFDMKSIKRKIENIAHQEISEMDFDVTCPHCNNSITIPKGKSFCPHCGNEIDLKLNINF